MQAIQKTDTWECDHCGRRCSEDEERHDFNGGLSTGCEDCLEGFWKKAASFLGTPYSKEEA